MTQPSESVNLECTFQSCTVHTSVQARVTDVPTHLRCSRLQSCICHSGCNCYLHVHFTLEQHMSVYKHLSVVHQRISVGLKVATKQSCICHGSVASSSDITGGKRSKVRGSSSSSNSSRIVNRDGHRSRYRHIPAAIQTANGRCDTTVAHSHERDSQWQNRHVQQHQHSTAERASETSCFQAVQSSRPHS